MSEVSEDNAVIRPTLHHLNLKTRRMQEMIDWYATVVGLRSVFQFPGGAWLTNDAANHRLALLTSTQLSEDLDQLTHTGMHHCAFEYAMIDDLLNTYVRLKAIGIEPHVCLDHGMTTSFYYVDPDGHSVELQVDNFGNWEESREWMRTSPQFAANPIGTPIDPEQMVAARKAGASFNELHRRAYAGEFQPAGPWTCVCHLGTHVPQRNIDYTWRDAIMDFLPLALAQAGAYIEHTTSGDPSKGCNYPVRLTARFAL